jgi:hypothetical protein
VRYLSNHKYPFFSIEWHFSTLPDVRENVGSDADFSATHGLRFFTIYYQNVWQMDN